MVERLRLVPCVYVLLLRRRAGRREVLLHLRRGTGYRDDHWSIAIAGHVDPGQPGEIGEDVLAAALREADEETGITLNPDPDFLRPVCVLHRCDGPQPWAQRVDFFFAAESWTGRPRLAEPHKAAALSWWPMDALPTPMVPHERMVIGWVAGGGYVPVIGTYGFPVDRGPAA